MSPYRRWSPNAPLHHHDSLTTAGSHLARGIATGKSPLDAVPRARVRPCDMRARLRLMFSCDPAVYIAVGWSFSLWTTSAASMSVGSGLPFEGDRSQRAPAPQVSHSSRTQCATRSILSRSIPATRRRSLAPTGGHASTCRLCSPRTRGATTSVHAATTTRWPTWTSNVDVPVAMCCLVPRSTFVRIKQLNTREARRSMRCFPHQVQRCRLQRNCALPRDGEQGMVCRQATELWLRRPGDGDVVANKLACNATRERSEHPLSQHL